MIKSEVWVQIHPPPNHKLIRVRIMADNNSTLTQKYLKEILHYTPDTGEFIWKVRIARRVHIGDIAGCLSPRGYITIVISGKIYLAHRLAFLYMTGVMPEQADHDNHIRNDNKWKNLNKATNTTNQRNQSLFKNNKSGCMGVCWSKASNKWVASIKVNGKRIYLGLHSELADAAKVRKTAEIKYGFHSNHGQVKTI